MKRDRWWKSLKRHLRCYKKIGIVDTLRFISQFTMGYGDYTQEREELFAALTLDDIVTEIKRRRDSTRSRQ